MPGEPFAVRETDVDRVVALTCLLRETPTLSEADCVRLKRTYVDARNDLAQLVPPGMMPPMAPGTANFPPGTTDPREALRPIDNDLAAMVSIAEQGVAHYFAAGIRPAPYYHRRILIILRKAKRWDIEADYAAAFHRHAGDAWSLEREHKARSLIARATGQPVPVAPPAPEVPALPPGAIAMVWQLVELLRKVQPPTAAEAEALRHARELSHSPGDDEKGEARDFAEASVLPFGLFPREDLAAIVQLIAGGINRLLDDGAMPPPQPMYAAADLLKRGGEFQCEAALCTELARVLGRLETNHRRGLEHRAALAGKRASRASSSC